MVVIFLLIRSFKKNSRFEMVNTAGALNPLV